MSAHVFTETPFACVHAIISRVAVLNAASHLNDAVWLRRNLISNQVAL
jgi:hypothetical protein